MMTKEQKEKLIIDKADEIDQHLTLAKIDLLKNEATTFLTGEVFRKQPICLPDLPCPTAGADGTNILLDPECWLNSNRAEKLGIVFHEGFHNMMGHCNVKAVNEDDHIIWNLAMDCVTEALRVVCNIGEQIQEAAVKPSSDGTVRLKINNKSLIISRCHEKTKEEVYDIIAKHVEKTQDPNRPGKPKITDENGNPIGPIDTHNLREFSPEEVADQEQRLRQALVEHKLRGTLPAGLSSVLERMLESKVNWKSELRDIISPEIKSYQSFSRQSKRGQALGMHLPGMVKEGVEVAFDMDTSGSMGQRELESGLGQSKAIFDQFEAGMVKLTLMLSHTHVYKVTEMDNPDALKGVQTDSGGTSHIDVFKKAEELGVKVLICFTDGESEFPDSTTIRKVLWLCTDESGMKKIPDHLGKKIFVPIKEFRDD